MMILAFLMNGEPNISIMTIVMKLRKPRPMYSADPHLLISRCLEIPFHCGCDLRQGIRGVDGGTQTEDTRCGGP
jgi:hypothetical protein